MGTRRRARGAGAADDGGVRVVISPSGPAILREAGVEVEMVDGAEAEAAELLNQPFGSHPLSSRSGAHAPLDLFP